MKFPRINHHNITDLIIFKACRTLTYIITWSSSQPSDHSCPWKGVYLHITFFIRYRRESLGQLAFLVHLCHRMLYRLKHKGELKLLRCKTHKLKCLYGSNYARSRNLRLDYNHKRICQYIQRSYSDKQFLVLHSY